MRRIVAVSCGAEKELVNAFPRLGDRVTVIPNGVSLDDSSGWRDRGSLAPEQAPVAVFVGSEWRAKGLRYAIDALVDAPPWRLVVVGRGDRNEFQRYANGLGVGERVQFVGWTEDVGRFYRAASAFVLPSGYETFSLVTYEAAAAGLPLLVTPVSGVDEILDEGETGWAILQDGKDIAIKLMTLYEKPDLRERMGTAARAAAREYPWSRMVDRYSHLYSTLLVRDEPAGS